MTTSYLYIDIDKGTKIKIFCNKIWIDKVNDIYEIMFILDEYIHTVILASDEPDSIDKLAIEKDIQVVYKYNRDGSK